jgi:hypothetical protein
MRNVPICRGRNGCLRSPQRGAERRQQVIGGGGVRPPPVVGDGLDLPEQAFEVGHVFR